LEQNFTKLKLVAMVTQLKHTLLCYWRYTFR